MCDNELQLDTAQSLSTTGTTNLYKTGNELTTQIIDETDPAKLEDLTNLFKANQKKKDIARINKLSNLLELVDDEVIMRVTSEPEGFKNGEIIQLMNVTQKSIDNLNNALEQVPIIQINNQKNEINITQQSSGLDLASRKRVLDVVKSILENQDVVEVESEEVK